MVNVWVVDFVSGEAWIGASCVSQAKATKLQKRWKDSGSFLVVLPLGCDLSLHCRQGFLRTTACPHLVVGR